ncbi:MAG: tetratricopeptide repeat protein [Clostridia bacterium]|nr:tetratricopeptide repeat protein [Clostridia bacterium]
MRKTIFCMVIIVLLTLTACNNISKSQKCTYCYENFPAETKFCPNCGESVSKINEQNGNATAIGKSEALKIPSEANYILNRDIYIFKRDFPQVYSGTINDINKTTAYVMDWKFSDILNESNFKNIKWDVSIPKTGAKTITFNGVAKNTQDNDTKITIEFYLQDGSETPLAWILYTDSQNSTSEITLQDFINRGINSDEALICTDATISMMAALFSNEAMQPVTVYYESLADDYMKNNDYENAIIYYKKAEIFGDKLSAAYYEKAEQNLAGGNLNAAAQCFGYAGNYKDSNIRVLEVYYITGKKYEQNNDYISAINSYQMAGNYSDAHQKYKECNFKQGEKYANNKQYIEALSCFESAADYGNSREKYKELCYLYAEQQLLVGALDSASYYFTKAGDYKDADTRIQRYYYENGIELFNTNNYLSAAEKFILAKNYADTKTMELECYYQYGKQQFSLNYISNAIAYLSKCRGYKDTDEILLSHYYNEALKSFDIFIAYFSKFDFTWKVDNAYKDAVNKLTLCEGYNNSTTLLKIVNKTYYVWNEMQFESKFNASLYRMNVSYSENQIIIDCNDFTQNSKGDLNLIYDLNNDTFNATITGAFSGAGRSYDVTKVICAMLKLFTTITDTKDIGEQLNTTSNWLITENNESFSNSYGGYNISINITESRKNNFDYKITATK